MSSRERLERTTWSIRDKRKGQNKRDNRSLCGKMDERRLGLKMKAEI